jgi:hypothetical protein
VYCRSKIRIKARNLDMLLCQVDLSPSTYINSCINQ